MGEIFSIKNIIIYLVAINFIAFFAMYIDKKKAEKNKWRIKEVTLLTLALMGGSIGAICGMYKFRHKTQKVKFTFGFPAILIIQILIVIYIIFEINI